MANKILSRIKVNSVYDIKGKDYVSFQGPVLARPPFNFGLASLTTGVKGCKIKPGDDIEIYKAENDYTTLGILGVACATCEFAQIPKTEGGCKLCFRK